VNPNSTMESSLGWLYRSSRVNRNTLIHHPMYCLFGTGVI
jgi:hypothetical protein